jgi:hypothetical protein
MSIIDIGKYKLIEVSIMGTRSNIGIENEDGTVDFVYCHWDGYVSNNGRILHDNYQDEDKVRKLIALGEISSLGASPSSTKDYHTWRGEEIIVQHSDDRNDAYQQEYCYIYSVEDQEWYVQGHEFQDWTPLYHALTMEEFSDE